MVDHRCMGMIRFVAKVCLCLDCLFPVAVFTFFILNKTLHLVCFFWFCGLQKGSRIGVFCVALEIEIWL